MIKFTFTPFIIVLLIVSSSQNCYSRQLRVGKGQPFSTLYEASQQTKQGDTILIAAGTYSGEQIVRNLHGTRTAPIVIKAEHAAKVIFDGNSEALHFSDCSYLVIDGFVFQGQTANGVNIDDGGSFDSPTHHLVIQNCEWKGINASGNNDELKLSGLDDFVIRNCRFANGSKGGSLIDMVGCHRGTIEQNTFEKAGSNCIQAKGGSENIIIHRNKFTDGGERAINIGGSTGLAFFRPQGAKSEASDVKVWSNIIIGGNASVAFVGALNCEVVNNTIIKPHKWVVRILQENNSQGMQWCAFNVFKNNIVVVSTSISVPVNVGPNTKPESFAFSHNFWFNPETKLRNQYQASVKETSVILNINPQFSDIDYRLKSGSPAIGHGFQVTQPERDYYNKPFSGKRSIGAVEYETK